MSTDPWEECTECGGDPCIPSCKRQENPAPKKFKEAVVVLHRPFTPNVKLIRESLKTRHSAPSSPAKKRRKSSSK